MTTAPYTEQLLALIQSPEFLGATLAGTPRLKKTNLQRITLRPVDLAEGRRLQISRFDDRKDTTTNHAFEDAPSALAEILAIGFANVHVTLQHEEIDIRLTKKGDVQVGRHPRTDNETPSLQHNRVKSLPIPEGQSDPVLQAMGILDRHGRVRPTMRDKFTQINEFLKLLDHVLPEVLNGHSQDRPLQLLDCGCGASYLTLAAHHFLTHIKHIPAETLGLDINEEVVAKSRAKAAELACTGLTFRTGRIGQLTNVHPDIVLALHACDTATDDAIAQAIRSEAKLLLAVPCCHKHLNSQLDIPALRPIHRHGILHQRQADLVTDAFRALILRVMGYRTEVIEFISPEHTARNLMIRAVKTSPPGDPHFVAEYLEFSRFTGVTPYLETALGLPSLGRP
jgi:hypothetical protein